LSTLIFQLINFKNFRKHIISIPNISISSRLIGIVWFNRSTN